MNPGIPITWRGSPHTFVGLGDNKQYPRYILKYVTKLEPLDVHYLDGHLDDVPVAVDDL